MPKPSYTLSELANHIGAPSDQPAIIIDGIASLKNAQPNQLSFYTDAKQQPLLATTQAGAVLIRQHDQPLCKRPALICDNPYLAFAKLSHLFRPDTRQPGNAIHRSAVIGRGVQIGQSVRIGANTVIGEGCRIGDRVRIAANCTIAAHCTIGDCSLIKAQVFLAAHTQIGKRAVIQPGAVLGGDGFGFVPDAGEWIKIEHCGNVVIGDDVEIGANTAIDRATLDSTVIGDGVKIDNLVHISHNDFIGDRTVIAACVGIAGSTTIGKDCKIGGAAMINGQISICDGTTITPATRIHKSITQSGRYSSGLLAVRHHEWLRNTVYFKKFYQLFDNNARGRRHATL